MPLPDNVTEHAAKRHSIVTRTELLGVLACTDDQVSSWKRRGLLQRVHRSVFGLGGVPMTPRREIYAAVLRCGEGAVAGGPSAAFLHGLEGFDSPGKPFVLVPANRRVTGVDFRVRYWALDMKDRCEIDRIPSGRIPLTLIDLAALYKPKVVRVAFDDARRKGRARADRVFERAAELGRRPGATELLALRPAFDKESEGERGMDRLFRPGDPHPTWQVWIYHDVRVDAAFLEARLVLEYQSRRWHGLDSDRGRDSQRALRLRADDIEVIDVTWEMLQPAQLEQTRQRILQVRAQRLAKGCEPIVPARRVSV